ncbi:beta-ketoacyl synthase domain-containing protein [Lasiosphaeria ovina]|uniref:Beta-ketoacyl synthase domain-containing protein n=1 Tax=Lasiosphaeria ovina TaxID=92902 RepID=A0AAE0NFH4_9PEZI|nr:beta-ketoacyl synthase domain-containing protein [Lasiosphaeria ovina]
MSDAIAVVGMSARLPGSETLSEFWDTLVQNKDLHQKVPASRWDAALHTDASGQRPNTTHSAWGCFIERPGAFDNLMFNISPRESVQTDPVQRLLLMATYEALEMAGFRYDANKPERNGGTRVGTFVGLATDDWREYNIAQEIEMYFVTGGLRSFASGRLNYFFKFEGPSYVVDTACSSSGAAVELACASLLGGRCDMAVAGGGNVMTGPNLWSGLSRGGFVSPTGGCKTFDETADGYCRGEGVGVVVLKRLADALAEGDAIQGVIRGVATNHSAYAPSITQPHAPTQVSLYREVLRKAGLSPAQVGYVEMHGTGTQSGDVTEMNSVVSTFGEGRLPDNPLYVGGVKANVGHGEGGGNTCVLVEEPPKPARSGQDPRTHHVVAVSAKNQASLTGNKQRLLDYLAANPSVPLEDIAYTTTARRPHHALRSVFTVSSLVELKQALTAQLAPSSTPEPAAKPSKAQPSVVFVFPGQGFNFCGLAKTLYATNPVFQQTLDELQDMCTAMDLPRFMDRVLDEQVADMGQLSPVQAHLAIVAIELGLARLLRAWGLTPSAVIGHSLGEYAALCTAGVLTVADTLLLVGRRAQLVEELCTKGTHGMLIVQTSADRFRSMVEGRGAGAFDVACFNGPSAIVVNGRMKNLEKIQAILHDDGGVKSSYVSVPYSFHSAQLDTILDDYRQVAAAATFSAPTVPVASTLLGRMVDTDGVFSAGYLAEQTRKPVRFEAAVKALQAAGFVTDKTLFVETGPGAMCLSMTQASLGAPCKLLPCLKAADTNWKTVTKVVADAYAAGIAVDWAEFHRPYRASLAVADLPTYHFNLKDYWIQYKGGVAGLEAEMATLKQQVATLSARPQALLPGLDAPQQNAAAAHIPHVSTCLHRVVSEDLSKATAEFSTNIQEPSLRALIDGHRVVGIALAPSSMYKETALSAARYLYTRTHPDQPTPAAMDLYDLVISSPMFLGDDASTPQLIRITASMAPGAATARITINTGKKEHCRCTVTLSPTAAWAKDWARRRYLLADRLQRLRDPAAAGPPVHHLRRDMVYKIFVPVTEYSAAYQSISEIFIDSAFREAAVVLDLRQTPAGDSFAADPCWLDNIAQTAGFVLNADVANPDDMLCMSTGCDLMRLTTAFTGGKRYLCHVRAEAVAGTAGKELVCDVTVVEEGEEGNVVALGEGLRFKRIKKLLLQKMLGVAAPGADAAAKPAAAPAVAKPVAKPAAAAPAAVRVKAPAAKRAAPPARDLSAVLALISKEIGTELDETEDSTTLEELGVDSLLTVSITTKLKAETGLELPTTLISGATSIAELREYFRAEGEDANDEYIATPVDGEEDDNDDDRSWSITNDNDLPSPASADGVRGHTSSSLMDAILAAIAKETGATPGEIDQDTPFTDLGIDSLMSVAVIGAVKDQTGEELPTSLFSDCETLAEVRAALGEALPSRPQKTFNPAEYTSKTTLLQGRPRSKGPILFLVTDGGGVAAVYVQVPALAPGLTVYSLDSPFMGTDSSGATREHDLFLPGVTVEGVASVYGRAIRAIQPHGPYLVGGYSIGGVFAYAVVNDLIAAGEEVHGFVTLDTACPRNLSGAIKVDVDVCDMMGMYDSISEEDQRKPLTPAQKLHIAGCVNISCEYDAVPLPADKRPRHVFCVWAKVGFVEHIADKVIEVGREIAKQQGNDVDEMDPEWVDWLESEKKTFGPRGWDKLCGSVETFVVEGDHFSIMMRPRVKTLLGPLLQKLMKRMLSTLDKPNGAFTATAAHPDPKNQTPAAPKPGVLSRAAVEAHFIPAAAMMPQFARELGCYDFLTRIYPAQKQLVLAYVVEAFAKLGSPLDQMAAGTPMVPPATILPRHAAVTDALLEILEHARLVEWRNGRRVRTYRPVETNKASAEQLSARLVRADAPHAGTHQLLHVTGSKLAECLTGAADPIQLIFGTSRQLLQDFYTSAPMFAAGSRVVAEHLRRVFASWTESDSPRPVEILEIGAGLGGTTKYVLETLVDARIPFRFVYTDISPSLVASSRKRYQGLLQRAAAGSAIEYMTLDVEKEAPAALVGRFDAVVSTCCVHATHSLVQSCSHARALLRPGGFLALVELVPAPRLAWLDLVFGLLEGWWLFDDGRKHCLADELFWKASLEQAGFRSVVWADTDDEVYRPNPQVIIACTD